MIDSEIVKPKIKIDKKPQDSGKEKFFQWKKPCPIKPSLSKNFQPTSRNQSNSLFRRERKSSRRGRSSRVQSRVWLGTWIFEGSVLDLWKIVKFQKIQILNPVLEPLNQTPVTLEEDDIADWYAYLETRLIKKPVSNGIAKSTKIETNQVSQEPQPQQQSSNIIRISKNDLPNIPKPIPQRKYNKKVKLNKEEGKLLQTVDNQLQNLNSENGSLMDFGTEKSQLKLFKKQYHQIDTDLSDAMKEKRKRKPKKDTVQQKSIQISPHDLIRSEYISINPLTDYRTKQQAPLHFLQLQPSTHQEQRQLFLENHVHVHENHLKETIKEN